MSSTPGILLKYNPLLKPPAFFSNGKLKIKAKKQNFSRQKALTFYVGQKNMPAKRKHPNPSSLILFYFN